MTRFIVDTEVKYFGAYRLSNDERRAVQEGLDQARRGEFASDAEVAALFARFRPKKQQRKERK